jgi:hypothetical protein
MVSTIRHDNDTTTTARPEWPQHVRDDRDLVDLRDDTSRPYVREERPSRGLRARRIVGWILAAAVCAAIAVVAAVNREGEVGIDLVFDEGFLPFWGVLAGSAFAGFVAGRLLDDGC